MKTVTINQRRLKKIATIPLTVGSHKSLSNGACVMEMVAYVAGEPWSHCPQCACPVLTWYAISVNDSFNNEHRQLLKPLITKLIGTRSTDKVQIARKRLMMWRSVTVLFPLILDCLKMQDHAEALRQFKNTVDDMAAAAAYLKKHGAEMSNYTDAYADAYTYAYADAYADAYTYAYADAYTYADAYADALRQTVAETAIETLQMAIEIETEVIESK